jgi:predicted  nucleic acid-binding Zn-ribbon protein
MKEFKMFDQKAAKKLIDVNKDISVLKDKMAAIGREVQALQQQGKQLEGALWKLSGAREVLEQLLAPAPAPSDGQEVVK